MKIGRREEAARVKHAVGGKAFPQDYNWVCRECGYENRAFEPTCQSCEHEHAKEQQQ